MNAGGPIPRPKPTQRSSQLPSVPNHRGSSTPHPHSGAEHGDEGLKRTIKKVSKLRGESKEHPLLLSTALLLIYMFPDDLGNDNLDVRRLSKWKEIFKTSKPNDLQAALNKMCAGFKLDPNHLFSFMSLNQDSGGNISDYNTFIQCCAIVEKHAPQKTSSSSGGQTKNPGASTSATLARK